jgi:hypothetical protein
LAPSPDIVNGSQAQDTRTLGERGGLPLGRPSQLLDLGGQLTNAGLQPLVAYPQPLDLNGEPIALGRTAWYWASPLRPSRAARPPRHHR